MSYSAMSSLLQWNETSGTTDISQNQTDSPAITSNTTFGHEGCIIVQFQDFIPWDNPDNIISFQTEQLIRKLKDVVFLPILFLIGGPANVINIAVFYKQGLKERINVCLFALSLADGLYLANNMLLYGEQLYLQFTTKEMFGAVMTFMTNHYLLGLYALAGVSEVLSAIIASERCFCILQPLRSQTVLRTSTMSAIIVAVFVVVVGLYFFVLARFNIVCAYEPASDRVMMMMIGSELYFRNQKFMDFLFVYVYGAGLDTVVMVVVIATTATTAAKLRKVAAWRASTSISGDLSAREIALTRMLVFNSVFFIVCVFPVAFFRFVLPFMPEMNAGRRHHNLSMAGLWVINISTYINATFNFVVYYTMGSRYRHTFWALFGRKTTKSKSAKISGTTATFQTVS